MRGYWPDLWGVTTLSVVHKPAANS